MSHPDPLYPCEDFDMDYNYDDHDAFYGEDSSSYHPDADHEVESQFDDPDDDFDDYSPEFDYDDYDDSMDGDHESALGSAGWGEDEYYGYYGEDY